MSTSRPIVHERRLVLPFVLLMLCLLALLVSVFGLYRTSSIAQSRFQELEITWQVLMQDSVQGAELLATDQLMRGISKPVPAVFSASQWSLALAVLSLVLLAWLAIAARSAYRARLHDTTRSARNDQGALLTLLDQIAPLTSGNLNVHATAGEGTPGALADAINYAVNQVRSLAGTQMNTARALSESLKKANELTASADGLCTSQFRQIHDGANVLLDMSTYAGKVSEHAAGVAFAAKKVLDAASQGSIASGKHLDRVEKLRKESQDPVELLQSLPGDAQGINDHMAHIDAVTKRIELLVLNSTLGASDGVEQEGSASFFSDINQLATKMARFAEEIRNSTQAIRASALGIPAQNAQALLSVRTLMEISDEQLHTCIAMQELFAEIMTHGTQLQAHTTGMSAQSVLHASGVRCLSAKMNSVNQAAQQALADVKANAQTLDSLKRVVSDLRQGLADYNLPDTHSAAPVGIRGDKASWQVRSYARRAADRAVVNE